MGKGNSSAAKRNSQSIHFSLIIFFVGLLLTITLWDSYFNGSRPFDREIASILVLIMGTLFSVAAGLFSWSIESRRDFLEHEVKRRTRELSEKNQELKQKNDEVENFIHIISHDLKAPLVSIQGFASILKTELGNSLQAAHADYLGRILTNTKQMNTLILDLLEFSRVGRIEDEKEVVDMEEVFDELIAGWKPELDKRSIKVELAEGVPKLWGSRKRLMQVFANLIGNAIKYMGSPAQPRVEIGCSDSEGNGMCTLWVKDNGIGIKKEYHQKIFQMFQRAPNQLKVEGTGIGLSIVKKIVELNEGSISIKSEEGKGSQFFVRWPKADGQPQNTRKVEAPAFVGGK